MTEARIASSHIHRRRGRLRTVAAAIASTVTLATLPVPAGSQGSPTPSLAARASRDLQIGAQDVWTSVDLELTPGERVVFTATGTARCSDQDAAFGPDGIPRGFLDLLRVLPVPQAGRGALIGRIGDADASQPFVIGSSAEAVAPVGGRLTIGVNRAESDACTAAFSVHLDVFSPSDGSPAPVAKRVNSIDGADRNLFARLPRRVSDNQGNPGDMVNFLILGSAYAMDSVFKTAGWVTVDRDVANALLRGVIGSLSKEAYLTMPMSQLYLFDRPQDFGWAHAEPIKVVASRHHLRVWRAPFQVAGSVLWVGAATHDIGFERDQRTGGVTHKIDPNVDDERDYVEKTLTGTGLVAEFTHVTPDRPLREAKTATGGRFQSDGRVLVLKLSESARPDR